MTDDYAKRLADQNAAQLRELQLEAELRRAQADRIDPTIDRTHAKLRAVVHRSAELLDELDTARQRILELEQLLDSSRAVAIALEGEVDACPDEEWHDAYAYAFPDVAELVAARERHPAGRDLELDPEPDPDEGGEQYEAGR